MPKKSIVKFITALLTASLLIGSFAMASLASAYTTESNCEHPFIDVDGHWGDDEICFLYEQGVIEGHSERNFYPNDDITRAEFLKISLLNLGYVVEPKQGYDFSDVDTDSWYYRYVTFAKFKGFVSGYDDGTFHPNDPITRSEAVVMIMDIADIIDYSTPRSNMNFSDISSSDWFYYAVAVATDYAIIEGYHDDTFRPYENITRAEAAAVAQRTWRHLYN